MSQLILTEEQFVTLKDVAASVAVCDPSGRPIGRYIPVAPDEPICPWEPTLTREEMDRRVRESKGRTWAEIRERLVRMRPL